MRALFLFHNEKFCFLVWAIGADICLLILSCPDFMGWISTVNILSCIFHILFFVLLLSLVTFILLLLLLSFTITAFGTLKVSGLLFCFVQDRSPVKNTVSQLRSGKVCVQLLPRFAAMSIFGFWISGKPTGFNAELR